MVLNSSIRTSFSPRWQRSYWGLRVTRDAYFSLLTHNKQLLLVTLVTRLKELKLVFGGTEPEPEREQDGQTDVEVEIVI